MKVLRSSVFWAVYLRGRENWWAIIPGGVLLTLALVTGLSSAVGGMAIPVVLFLGLALTFAVLAVLSAIGAEGVLNYVWPAALGTGGLYLILRALGLGRKPKPHG